MTAPKPRPEHNPPSPDSEADNPSPPERDDGFFKRVGRVLREPIHPSKREPIHPSESEEIVIMPGEGEDSSERN